MVYMDWYITLVKAHPILTAMVQFAALGTLGETASKWLAARRFYLPFGVRGTVLRMLGRAALS